MIVSIVLNLVTIGLGVAILNELWKLTKEKK
jgi:hypothetical protein